MQLKLREICFALAASLIYTSAIENGNTITLQKYIFHRLYMDEFKTAPAAEVLNPNSLFIPAGWDALESLEDIVPKDGPINKNLDFDIVIPNTSTGSITETKKKDETVTAYPEDVFLQRLFDKQVKDDRLSSSGVSDAKLRGAMSEMSDQSGSTLVANTSRSKQSRRKSLADAIGKASAGSINSKSSSNSSSSRSGSGKKNSSKISNNVNPSADPKENPKLIKNFFQSLLKEPRKTSRAGSRAKKKG